MKFKFFERFQQLGRALMLPIALLPVAGLLLRFGQPDLLNLKYIAESGNIIFTNLPILFAIGVAIGLAKNNNGTAGLAGIVGYLIMTTILSTMNAKINTGVLGGIIIGIVAALLYNRFKDIQLPDYLAFFGGKRFVPIATGISAVFLGIALGYIWPPIQNGINNFAIWLTNAGAIGVFFYGVLNRFLIITGLHHVLNNLVWFVFGNYTNSQGLVVHGDIARFMANDPTAGTFMAGFFPILMFGLPAACLAMYKNAFPENKAAVAGLLLSMALTSFLTGVTEPIEFSFIFLAPILYVIHSLLTGASMAVMYVLHVYLGFTFSAGAIDYLLFFKQGSHPLYLLPVGLVFFVIYYFTFDFFIRYYNLPTIGRDVEKQQVSLAKADSRALQFIEALGGSGNLVSVDACTTRLRLVVVDSSIIVRDMLKALGARGVLIPNKETLQVILGTIADTIASEIREAMVIDPHAVHTSIKSDLVNNHQSVDESQLDKSKISLSKELSKEQVQLAQSLLELFGGKDNIQSLKVVAATRLRVALYNAELFNAHGFELLPSVHLIEIDKLIKQVYIGDQAVAIFKQIETI